MFLVFMCQVSWPGLALSPLPCFQFVIIEVDSWLIPYGVTTTTTSLRALSPPLFTAESETSTCDAAGMVSMA